MDLLPTILLGAAAAGFVQGLTGFGFSLTCMSIWAWTLEPRLAVSLAVFGGLVGQLVGTFTVRRGFAWSRLWPFLAGAAAGLPLGLFVLPRLDVPLFKTVLGLFLVVFCPLLFFAARLPRIARGGRAGDAAAGAVGGFMGALGGFSGVAPSLWCTLRGFPKDEQRAVVQNFNLALLAVTFASYLVAGVVQRATLPLLAFVVPAMLGPSLLGARLYHGMGEAAFRRVVLGLLTASGVALLAGGLPAVLRGATPLL